MRKLGLTLGALFLAPGLALAADGARITYDNGTKIEVPAAGFDMQLKTSLATYYSYTTVKKHGGNANNFNVARADLMVGGNVADKAFSYYLRHGFVGADMGVLDIFTDASLKDDVKPVSENDILKEAWIQWNAAENAYVRMGRQKIMVGLQSSIDEEGNVFGRPAISIGLSGDNSAPARGDGISAGYSVKMDCDALNLVAGVYNGQHGGSVRDQIDVTGVFEINFAGNGYDRTYEGDYYQTKNLAWTAGAGVMVAEFNDEHAYLLAGDLGLKISGVALQAEVMYQNIKEDRDYSFLTYYLQGSAFAIPKQLEFGLRFGQFRRHKDGAADKRNSFEYSGVANYYLVGPALKWQTGLSYYRVGVGARTLPEWRVMTGLVGNF